MDKTPLFDYLDEDSFQALLWIGNQIPGGFIIYSADGSQEILYVNRAALKIFGCSTVDEFRTLTGNTFSGLVHYEDYDTVQSSIDRQIEDDHDGKLDYVEYRITRKDGEVRWVDDYGHFAKMPGFGNVYYVFLTDATEKHKTRDEMLRAELELVREKQRNEIKANFLFNMSHDIRTPMNAIVGFSELAKRHMNEPKLLADYLDKTIDSSQQLLSLIDDMLEMNLLGAGNTILNEEPAFLSELISIVIDMFRLDAEKKQIELVSKIDLPDEEVLIDKSRFSRIIANLLSNAVKFTHPGGTITISATKKNETGNGSSIYEFQISDNGIGISKEFIGRIFDQFEREESSTKSGSTGTGLGLSIVKSLLSLMGGSITVESVKGEGSVFTVTLPIKPYRNEPENEISDADETEIEAQAAPQYRILIVEDIEMNRELVETLLEECGFLTESVVDGNYAVEAVENHPEWYYDLILMDIQMPVMNGYDATRAIRALPREDVKQLPIIALSANSRDEDKQMSMESGMNAHIAKPFDIDELVNSIMHFVSVRPH